VKFSLKAYRSEQSVMGLDSYARTLGVYPAVDNILGQLNETAFELRYLTVWGSPSSAGSVASPLLSIAWFMRETEVFRCSNDPLAATTIWLKSVALSHQRSPSPWVLV
jgi:hypothetical protein